MSIKLKSSSSLSSGTVKIKNLGSGGKVVMKKVQTAKLLAEITYFHPATGTNKIDFSWFSSNCDSMSLYADKVLVESGLPPNNKDKKTPVYSLTTNDNDSHTYRIVAMPSSGTDHGSLVSADISIASDCK